jgi:hypothetical protein
MSFTGFFRFVERAIPWGAGLLFTLFSVMVAVRLPTTNNKVVGAYLAYLLLHIALMLIVGASLQKAKRFWAISWVVVLALFFVVAAVFRT